MEIRWMNYDANVNALSISSYKVLAIFRMTRTLKSRHYLLLMLLFTCFIIFEIFLLIINSASNSLFSCDSFSLSFVAFPPRCFDAAASDRFQRRPMRRAFSRHSSIIHATKRALFQISFAPANISPIQLSAYCARCARARAQHTCAGTHRRSIFRIVRRIPVVSGRDVKLPGGWAA